MSTEPTAEQKARVMIDELMSEHAQGGVHQSPPHVIYTLVARLLSRAERAEREAKEATEYASALDKWWQRRASLIYDMKDDEVVDRDSGPKPTLPATLTRNSAGGGE